VLWSGVVAIAVQGTVPADGAGLGTYWFTNGDSMSDAVGFFLLNDFFTRAFGMMLIGVSVYRLGALQGTAPAADYWKMVRWGLGIGLPVAVLGLVIQAANGFSPSIAVIGEIPNTIATIPVVVGYVGLISLWNRRTTTWLHERVRAAGRMALTNYLTQTLIGVLALRGVLGNHDFDRAEIALFVIAVWAIQILWSKVWLDHFAYGPAEWAWRSATYRRYQPLRRRMSAGAQDLPRRTASVRW